MARWCTLTLLLLALPGLPGSTFAQMYDPAAPGVEPAGWSQSGYAQSGQKAKVRSYGPMGPLPAGPGRTIYEELPDDQGWLYQDTPLERALKNTFRHAYFRTDYLLWNVSEPGNNLIGADTAIIGFDEITRGGLVNDLNNTYAYPTSANGPFLFQPFIDPSTPFQVSNPDNPDINNTFNALISVVQPSLQDVDIDNNNGVRLTFGLPTNIGTFEANVFALQTSTSSLHRPQTQQFDVYDSNGNGIFGEIFTPLLPGEFDRDGNMVNPDVVSSFQAFAIPILVDGQVPQLGVADSGNTPNVTAPQLPPFSNPLSPGTFLNPSGTIQTTPGRGDNFRIVWAVSDPNDPTTYVSTYQAALRTSVWGSEANFLAEPWDPGSPLAFRPIMGFRYIEFRESFSQTGNYEYVEDDPRATGNQTLQTISPRSILSSTINNMYGPQLGFRAELPSRWFTVGVQPKVMMGLNTYKATLDTQNVLRPDSFLVATRNSSDPVGRAELLAAFQDPLVQRTDDVDQSLRRNESTFGVIGDLETYTRLHLTEYFSLHVGYNLMWVGMLTRPYDNVVYNARTVQIPNPNGDGTVTNRLDSDFKLDVHYSGAILQGLNIGAELQY